MSWKKIEKHLFDKYCTEGDDKTFKTLQKEHDIEVIRAFAEILINIFDKRTDEPYIQCSGDLYEGEHIAFLDAMGIIDEELNKQEERINSQADIGLLNS